MQNNSGVRHFLQAVNARAYPRIWGMSRAYSWILFETVIPIINTTAFVFLYRAIHAPEAYIGFLIVGATLTSYWHNVVWAMGTQMNWEKQNGNLELYVLAPSPMMAILVGMSVGGIFQASLRAVMIGLIGVFLFGVRIELGQWYYVLVVFGVLLVSLYGLGMVIGSLFLRWGREAWQLALALHEPTYFLSGLNFPLIRLFRTVPGFVCFLSALLPISFGLDALRQLLFPGLIEGVLRVRTELGVLALLGVVYITIAHFALIRMERSARVEATLSLRWQ